MQMSTGKCYLVIQAVQPGLSSLSTVQWVFYQHHAGVDEATEPDAIFPLFIMHQLPPGELPDAHARACLKV